MEEYILGGGRGQFWKGRMIIIVVEKGGVYVGSRSWACVLYITGTSDST